MYAVDLDLIIWYVPLMADTGEGIRLTRTIELPFPPVEEISIFSRVWQPNGEPLGYVLKDITWDLDRQRFFAETGHSISDTPIAMIPYELRELIDSGWTYGSFKDSYQTERNRGRKRGTRPAIENGDWDFDEAAEWDTSTRNRPKEFRQILQAVGSTMAELGNNCHVAYAMLKTGFFFNLPSGKLPSQLSPQERRFYQACRTFESLTFDQQCYWREGVTRRYSSLRDAVAAVE